VERRSKWRCMDTLTFNARSVSKPFGSLNLQISSGVTKTNNKTQLSQLQTFKVRRRQDGWARLLHQQTHAKVKRTGSFRDKAEEDAPDVSLQDRILRRYSAVQNHRALEFELDAWP
jgi:hypothetical protein